MLLLFKDRYEVQSEIIFCFVSDLEFDSALFSFFVKPFAVNDTEK